MKSGKNTKNYRKVEIYVAVLIVLFFCTIFSRYVYFSSSANNFFSYISNSTIKKSNADYLDSKEKQSDVFDEFLLKIDQKGVWSLFDSSGVVNKNYLVENSEGKILLRRVGSPEAKNLFLSIDNVRDYFSHSGIIVTDIPYNLEDGYFSVTEQEDLFPIFGYHGVFNDDENIKDPYSEMKRSDFENQIIFYNQEMNCYWLTIGDIVENFILKNKKIPRNVCAINFDDGKKNNYEVIFPILKRNNVVATFYIIFGHLGKKAYMTKGEISELFKAGNEIGSHTVVGGGLVNANWYREGEFTREELIKQIQGSKFIAEDYLYNSKTFAYPLGEWNSEIVSVVKDAGYIAARDTEKDDGWRDRRALATSMDDDFIWHLNYYKPELRYNEEIKEEVGYTGWWQFEEGNLILNDENNNVKTLNGFKLTNQSYAIVSLIDRGDTNSNSFILEKEGDHDIDLVAMNNDPNGYGFSVLIDDKRVNVMKNQSQDCSLYNNKYYCHYLVNEFISAGKHVIKIVNESGQTELDRFKISRDVFMRDEYKIIVR